MSYPTSGTKKRMALWIGTSGWQYKHWRTRFYPERLPSTKWLTFYADSFQTVEINSSFYQLPSAAAVDRWRAAVPDDFVFCPKASRYLTHYRRLREPEEPVQLFMDRLGRLEDQLGPVLLQLPPTLHADPGALDDTLSAFGSRVRVAVEARHRSWFTPEIRDILIRHNAALCAADRCSELVAPLWRTADWAYVRLHEGRSHPATCYGRAALRSWLQRVEDTWGDVETYLFFNNDGNGCAIQNAATLARQARRAGIECSRTPA